MFCITKKNCVIAITAKIFISKLRLESQEPFFTQNFKFFFSKFKIKILKMSGLHLLRPFGKFSSKVLKSPNFIPSKRCYALHFGNGNGLSGGSYTNPECIKQECDPKNERHDKKVSNDKEQVKKDQIGTYRNCPPPAKKAIVKCDDLPAEPQLPRRKRKPFVPAAACKKPTVSLSASVCDKIKEVKCKVVQMPNCSQARIPPKCLIVYKRPDCKRNEYKLPAFSECVKLPKKNRFDECECQEKARSYN